MLDAALASFAQARIRGHVTRRAGRRARCPQADDPLLLLVQGRAARCGDRPRRRPAAGRVASRRAPRRPSAADPLTAVVDTAFRLGARRPELLELLREILRLGPPASTRLTAALDPLLKGAATVLPERVVLTACAMVIGMATEVEVLRSLGVEPDRAALRRRRRELLAFLQAAVGAA